MNAKYKTISFKMSNTPLPSKTPEKRRLFYISHWYNLKKIKCNTVIILLFVMLLFVMLLTSCKQNLFLIKKYYPGHSHSKNDNRQLPDLSFEKNLEKKVDSITNKVVTNNSITTLEQVHAANSIQKKVETKPTALLHAIKKHILVKPSDKVQSIIRPFHKQIEKSHQKNKDKNSSLNYYVKMALLIALFWVVMIVLYGGVFAIELASILAVLKIVGIVLLAAIIWLSIYFIIEKTIKK
jgi:hypothetical protein